MEQHLVHLLIIGLGFILGLIIWFWDSFRQRRFYPDLKLLIVLGAVLVIFHLSFSGLVSAGHQIHDSTQASHSCCLPQIATLPVPVTAPSPYLIFTPYLNQAAANLPLIFAIQINNKSPPSFFS